MILKELKKNIKGILKELKKIIRIRSKKWR